MITDAIKTAQTEHVVYFLLTAYVEALGYYDPPRSSLPPYVNRLPIAGMRDVTERFRALRETLDSSVQQDSSGVRALIREAVDVFDTASQRLRILGDSGQLVRSWNVVERSRHGHERRRRLGWQMTERQAAEWTAAHGTQLERADQSA